MESYESMIGTLEAELGAVSAVFRGLERDQWRRPTLLMPVDPGLPRWTVFELAGHFDIAIGLTRMLIAGREDVQPARDRTSFFINPRSETGPGVYSYLASQRPNEVVLYLVLPWRAGHHVDHRK